MEKLTNRLKRKVIIENLWLFVLSMLEKKTMIGYEIRDEIKRRHGFWCGNVTGYKVLYMLEKGGYVKAGKVSGKIFYTISAKGKKELKDGKQFLKSIAK